MSKALNLLLNFFRFGDGEPTDTPDTAAIYIDTTNAAFYCYAGGWGQIPITGAANIFTAGQVIDLGATSGGRALLLTGDPLEDPGTRDSPTILWRGFGYTAATNRAVDYIAGVGVVEPDGTDDAWVLARAYNGGGSTPVMYVRQNGDVVPIGDIDAAGGYRSTVGFGLAALAANQAGVTLDGPSGSDLGFVAQYPGSVTAISAIMSDAVTGGSVTVGVYINGVLAGSATTTFVGGGGETNAYVVQPKDSENATFAAGDIITVRYTSGAINETPALGVYVGIEC